MNLMGSPSRQKQHSKACATLRRRWVCEGYRNSILILIVYSVLVMATLGATPAVAG